MSSLSLNKVKSCIIRGVCRIYFRGCRNRFRGTELCINISAPAADFNPAPGAEQRRGDNCANCNSANLELEIKNYAEKAQ